MFLGRAAGFEEVPRTRLHETAWRVIGSRRWRRKGGILELEASSLGWAVRHLCRRGRGQEHRHLLLTDNLAVASAVAKGRATHFGLNRVCRQ
eukprot:12053061-Heterocapsa_arctica.AAC.1